VKLITGNKTLFYILAIAIFASNCLGDTGQERKAASKVKISVTDFRNKELHFNRHPERVVCLIESALTGIYMLGAQNKIVGVSSNIYSDNLYAYYSRMDQRIADKTLAVPGNWDYVSIEKIVTLKPDLVIIWSSQTEAIENIENFDIPVYGVMLHSLDDVIKEIKDFGILFNKENRSDSLIRFTKNNLEKIAEKTKGQNKKRVYFAWMQGITETSGKNSMVDDLIEASGGINVCDYPEEHAVVNLEKIVEWNPEAIVMWCNDKTDPSDMMLITSLKNVNAVQSRRVFEFPSVFECDLWTLKFQYASLLLVSWLYPEKFSENELDSSSDEIFKILYNTNINLSHEK
jgi:iron complex transport system substrate-binding protein